MTCGNCGAIHFQDSGWALPVYLVGIRSLFDAAEEAEKPQCPGCNGPPHKPTAKCAGNYKDKDR